MRSPSFMLPVLRESVRPWHWMRWPVLALVVTLAACASPNIAPPEAAGAASPSRPQRVASRPSEGAVSSQPVALTNEVVWAVTVQRELVQFHAAQPDRLLQRRFLNGLASGEEVLGLDFRTGLRGHTLYAWSSAGRLYTLDTASATLHPVSPPAGSGVLSSAQLPHGVEVDPMQDQLRVIDASGRNWRVDFNTGMAIDTDSVRPGLQTDGRLVFAQRDWNAETTPQLLAIAHSQHAGASTAFAIDRSTGSLVSQGSRAGAQPVVSPNFGRLYTVGPLGLAPLQDAAFDIAPRTQVALAAIRTTSEPRTGLYHINLDSGQARWVGWVGDGTALRGLAIQP